MPAPTLSALPDDVLLRILHLSGDAGDQIGLAYRLSMLSPRFRALLHRHFLPSLTSLTADSLRSLSLADPVPAHAALTSLCRHAVSVRRLDLSGLSPALLSRPAVSALADAAAAALTYVQLTYCRRVTDAVLDPLLACPNLVSLSLHSCSGITGAMFAHPAACAPLTFLDLSWVHTLTRDGVHAIAAISTLQTVIFTGCDAVNSRTLPAFATAPIATSLVHVGLAYCPVKDTALLQLVHEAKGLRKMVLAESTHNLWETGNFSARCVDEIRRVYPHVEIVFTT